MESVVDAYLNMLAELRPVAAQRVTPLRILGHRVQPVRRGTAAGRIGNTAVRLIRQPVVQRRGERVSRGRSAIAGLAEESGQIRTAGSAVGAAAEQSRQIGTAVGAAAEKRAEEILLHGHLVLRHGLRRKGGPAADIRDAGLREVVLELRPRVLGGVGLIARNGAGEVLKILVERILRLRGTARCARSGRVLRIGLDQRGQN